MTIGIDMDDTLTNTAELLLAYAQKYDYEHLKRNISLSKDKVFSIINGNSLENGMVWSKQQSDSFKNKYHESVLQNASIKPFAKEIIDKLIQEGNKIFFVTARNNKDDRISDSYLISKKLLENNHIKYHKLITECSDKLSICKENNIDLFIDDKLETCLELKNNGITALLMNTPLNNNLNEEDVIRVYSWIDIYYKKEYYSLNQNG